MMTTARAGVTFDVDLNASPGIVLCDGRGHSRSRYAPRELDYLRARLEGADTIGVGMRCIAHRIGRLTIYLDRAQLGLHDRPSAQSIADYVSCALERQ